MGQCLQICTHRFSLILVFLVIRCWRSNLVMRRQPQSCGDITLSLIHHCKQLILWLKIRLNDKESIPCRGKSSYDKGSLHVSNGQHQRHTSNTFRKGKLSGNPLQKDHCVFDIWRNEILF